MGDVPTITGAQESDARDSGETRIGRFVIPFPFSILVSLIFLPLLFIAAGISVPVTVIRRYLQRRAERRVAEGLRHGGRVVEWSEARGRCECKGGTFIEEYLSLKGPWRLWWTPDAVPGLSPLPCCFAEYPYAEADGQYAEFWRWCGGRYCDLKEGTAHLVVVRKEEEAEVSETLRRLRVEQRVVSVVRLLESSG